MKRTRSQQEEELRMHDDDKSSDNESSSSDEEMQEEAGEELMIDFEVNEPNFDADYHGVDFFVQQLLHGDAFDFSPLVELVLGDEENKQVNPLTSVVKIPYEQITAEPLEGDEVDLREWNWNEDTYGVISLASFGEKAVNKPIGKWLVEKCTTTGDKSLGNRMKNLVEAHKDGSPLGLVLNMHVMNLPFELSSKLHENLWDEYRELVDKKQMEPYKNVVLVSTVYEPKKKKHSSKKKFGHSKSIYPKYEESFYAKHASFQHRFPLSSSDFYNNDEVSMLDRTSGDRYGVIMVVPVEEIPQVLQEMNSAASQPTKQ